MYIYKGKKTRILFFILERHIFFHQFGLKILWRYGKSPGERIVTKEAIPAIPSPVHNSYK